MPDLTQDQARDFIALAGQLIPRSAEYAMPGADDPAIAASLLANLGRDADDVRAALAILARLAGGPYAALPPERQRAVMDEFNLHKLPAIAALHRVVLLCYYRDDRVMRALGQEPRPPFPKGHTVEQGDWSLLDPVRARAPLWRNPQTPETP